MNPICNSKRKCCLNFFEFLKLPNGQKNFQMANFEYLHYCVSQYHCIIPWRSINGLIGFHEEKIQRSAIKIALDTNVLNPTVKTWTKVSVENLEIFDFKFRLFE